MLKEFKAFVMRGNVLDLAVAVIIGAAFGAIVTSLVNDVVMPPIGLLLGKVDFKDLFVKQANRFQKPAPAAAPTTKDCPFCLTSIPLGAKRCPNCTSQL